jgi:hypothetical protein
MAPRFPEIEAINTCEPTVMSLQRLSQFVCVEPVREPSNCCAIMTAALAGNAGKMQYIIDADAKTKNIFLVDMATYYHATPKENLKKK